MLGEGEEKLRIQSRIIASFPWVESSEKFVVALDA